MHIILYFGQKLIALICLLGFKRSLTITDATWTRHDATWILHV